jgi:hypothetical protein
VRHPEQTGTSSELNWQRTFLLLPAPCQIVQRLQFDGLHSQQLLVPFRTLFRGGSPSLE